MADKGEIPKLSDVGFLTNLRGIDLTVSDVERFREELEGSEFEHDNGEPFCSNRVLSLDTRTVAAELSRRKSNAGSVRRSGVTAGSSVIVGSNFWTEFNRNSVSNAEKGATSSLGLGLLVIVGIIPANEAAGLEDGACDTGLARGSWGTTAGFFSFFFFSFDKRFSWDEAADLDSFCAAPASRLSEALGTKSDEVDLNFANIRVGQCMQVESLERRSRREWSDVKSKLEGEEKTKRAKWRILCFSKNGFHPLLLSRAQFQFPVCGDRLHLRFILGVVYGRFAIEGAADTEVVPQGVRGMTYFLLSLNIF